MYSENKNDVIQFISKMYNTACSFTLLFKVKGKGLHKEIIKKKT